MISVRRALYWGTPSLLCLILYWFGLRAWFQQDDFAWLGLDAQIHRLADWPATLFAPLAQGTIRPWSERIYFIALHGMFGMRIVPFKLVTFATAVLDFILLCEVMRKITKSDVAGFTAPILWVCNAALITPLSWAACYNEIQCSGFLLLSFYFLLRYLETDDRRWYWAQFACFTVGLGSLELDVTYPALALAYAIFCARRAWRGTLPMFAVSLVYASIHRSLAPKTTAYIYRMYVDKDLWSTFATYWQWVLGPGQLAELFPISPAQYAGLLGVLTVLIVAFVLWQAIRKRQFLGFFFLAWYCITLSPMLPLKNHITEYYLTLPAIGIAMLGGWAAGEAWRASSMQAIWRGATAIAIAIYIGTSIPVIQKGADFYYQRGREVKNVVQSMAYAHKIHPGKILLIKGVSHDLFYSAFYDRPYRIFGLNEIYLTPESESNIKAYREEMGEISTYFLPAKTVGMALERNEAVVYDMADPLKPIRNVTQQYLGQINADSGSALPRRIELGNSLYNDQILEGWYGAEPGFRWMPKQAAVILGGPSRPDQKLIITAHCPKELVKDQPVTLTILFEGKPIGSKRLDAEQTGEFEFPLPADFLNRPNVLLTLSIDRTVRIAGDTRNLGLAVGQIAIR